MSVTMVLGPIGFTDRGVYDSLEIYRVNDLVKHQNGMWRCLVANTVQEPTVSNMDWSLWVKGVGGEEATENSLGMVRFASPVEIGNRTGNGTVRAKDLPDMTDYADKIPDITVASELNHYIYNDGTIKLSKPSSNVSISVVVPAALTSYAQKTFTYTAGTGENGSVFPLSQYLVDMFVRGMVASKTYIFKMKLLKGTKVITEATVNYIATDAFRDRVSIKASVNDLVQSLPLAVGDTLTLEVSIGSTHTVSTTVFIESHTVDGVYSGMTRNPSYTSSENIAHHSDNSITTVSKALQTINKLNALQNSRLDAIEIQDTIQNGRLDAVNSTDVTQDTRLDTAEMEIGILKNANPNRRINYIPQIVPIDVSITDCTAIITSASHNEIAYLLYSTSSYLKIAKYSVVDGVVTLVKIHTSATMNTALNIKGCFIDPVTEALYFTYYDTSATTSTVNYVSFDSIAGTYTYTAKASLPSKTLEGSPSYIGNDGTYSYFLCMHRATNTELYTIRVSTTSAVTITLTPSSPAAPTAMYTYTVLPSGNVYQFNIDSTGHKVTKLNTALPPTLYGSQAGFSPSPLLYNAKAPNAEGTYSQTALNNYNFIPFIRSNTVGHPLYNKFGIVPCYVEENNSLTWGEPQVLSTYGATTVTFKHHSPLTICDSGLITFRVAGSGNKVADAILITTEPQ